MDRLELLRSVPIFAQLKNEHLSLLAEGMGTQVFERGTTIFHQGSVGDVFYIIVTGQVRIYTISEIGQELSVMICRDGDFFGEFALFDGQPRSASAVTMWRTEVRTLTRTTLRRAIRALPDIALVMLETMSGRIRQTNIYMEHLLSHSAPQRVVRRLLDLAEHYGVSDGEATRIDLRLTQDDLASLAGTTRETVNRVLASLRDQGLIRVERARVSVLNLSRLEQSLDKSLDIA